MRLSSESSQTCPFIKIARSLGFSEGLWGITFTFIQFLLCHGVLFRAWTKIKQIPQVITPRKSRIKKHRTPQYGSQYGCSVSSPCFEPMLRTSVEGNEGQQLDLPNGKHGDHLWNSQQANSLLFTPGARFEIAGRQFRILQRRQGIWRGMVSTSSSNCETQPYLIVCRRSSFVPHPWHLFSSPLYDV